MTVATRKAAERQRKEAAGLVRVEVWVPAEDAEAVRELARAYVQVTRFEAARVSSSRVKEAASAQTAT